MTTTRTWPDLEAEIRRHQRLIALLYEQGQYESARDLQRRFDKRLAWEMHDPKESK